MPQARHFSEVITDDFSTALDSLITAFSTDHLEKSIAGYASVSIDGSVEFSDEPEELVAHEMMRRYKREMAARMDAACCPHSALTLLEIWNRG